MDVHEALVGPEGWLDGFEVGDLLAVRLQGGAVALERIAEAGLDRDAAARTAARLVDTHEMLGGKNPLGGPVDVPALLLETLTRAPLTLGPLHPPLGELLEQAGLDLDHLLHGSDGPHDTEDAGSVARGEVDPAEQHDAMLAVLYGHDEAALAAHHRLLADVARIARDGIDCLDEAALEEAAGALGDAAVAESLADAVVRLDRSMIEALGELAQRRTGAGGVAGARARPTCALASPSCS